jgi:hypothetical protein
MKTFYYQLKISICFLLFISQNIISQTVIVPAANTNNGSVNDPLGSYWGFERTALIYTSTQIGATGNINSVGFYLNSVTAPGASTNVRVYMKMRTTLLAANTSYATEITGATLVYGPTTIPAGSFVAGGWVTLPLTTNFNYTGGLNNLEIIIETNATGFGSGEGTTGKQFRYTTQANVQYYEYWNADNTAPAGNGTRSSLRPNVRLNFVSTTACAGTPANGTSAISVATGCSGTSFNLTSSGLTAGTGITYQWQSSANAGGPWTNIVGATSASYATSTTSTTYYRIVTTCSNGGATGTSNTVSFTPNTCTGSITMTDGFGDGWNGGTMQLYVNGSLFQTFGSTFTTGASQTINFCLPAASTYSLVYNNGGTYPAEVGVSLTVNSTLVYSIGAGGATVGATLVTGEACPPPPTTPPNCVGAPTAPTNGQTGVSPSQILSWPAVSGAASYDVYFGTNNPPTNIVNGTNQAGTTYNPGTLLNSTNYYWKIVPRNVIGAATGCSVWSFSTGIAGCANGTAFGTVNAPTDNTPVTISTAQYQSEYSTINSVSAGSVYQSSYSLGGFITVHQGTPAGPIIAYGATPLTWTATVAGTYYVHYNTTAFPGCGVASLSGTSIITCLSCPPPPTNWLAQFQSMNIGSSNWCVGEVRTVTVTVKNAGIIAWTDATPDINIGVKWNSDLDYPLGIRANAGGLAAGATGTYTFLVTAPLTAGGENLSFDVVNEGNFWFASNANGSGPGNVVYTSTSQTITPYPAVSAGTNTTICVGNTAQLNGTSSLTFTNKILETNFNNGAWPTDWTRTSNNTAGVGPDYSTSLENPSALGSTWAGNGYTGYCSFFYSYWVGAGVTGDMISPSMNLSASTTATLTFWIYNSDGTDVLNVYANTNNGAYAQVGTTYATYGAWTQISISLNAYCGGANTNVKLKFTGTSDYGISNIGIDDIIVQSTVIGTPTNGWTSSPAGFTSASLTPNVSPSSTTNYSLTATYNGCANISSVVVTIDNPIISPAPATGDYIWRGSTSTGWSVPSNWYVYNGTSYSVASVASTSNDDVIIPANGTCIIQQPIVGVPGSAQNITVNSGASLTLNSGSTITAKNITIASTGTLSMNGVANSTLNVSGNWQDNGTFNAGVGTVNFNGTTAQSINKNSGNEVFANVIVNKASNALTLNSPIEIGTNITLTSGLVNSDATNLLIINDNATTTGASNTSHVVGPVRKIGNEAFTFPVGKGNNYAPAAIGAPSLTTDHFTAEYFNSDPNGSYNVTLKDVTINNISACEYWIIDRTAGLSDVTVNLSWNTPRSCGVNDPTELLLARWDGSSWKDHGNGGTTGNNTAGSINTAAVVTNFSPFTLASKTSINPLPIELTNYDLSCENKKVVINWSTASEINNNFYTIERSADGLTFESIAFVNGNGTTVTKNNYSYTDTNPIDGLSYYQLKQTDYNGQSKTYSLRSINCENKNSDVLIYPNPNKGMFTIQGTELGCEVTITDVLGKVIYSIKGNEQKTQVILQNLSRGIYYININKNDTNVTKKIAID